MNINLCNNMNKIKYLQQKSKSNNEKKLNNIYKYNTSNFELKKNNNNDLYNYVLNIENIVKEKRILENINKNLKKIENYEIDNIFKSIKLNNIDKLLFSILYCIDSNITFLDIPLFLKEFKQYIIYDISKYEFENKNKILKNIENENTINHNTLTFLSNYLNINIVIIRYNNFYKIISNEKYDTIILIKSNNNYYSLYNKIKKSYLNDNIDYIENIFKKYNNYDFTILKAISSYKIDELKEICMLFDIELLNNGKKKIKKELYEELLIKI